MPIDPNADIPTFHPLNVASLLGGGDSMEQQRLDLMKQEFENTKRKQAEAAEWARTEEAGRNARAQMIDQRDREAQQAAQKAKMDELKRASMTKFSELNGQGKYDEARAMLPEMNQLGMSVDLQGEVGGLPSYRVHMSPEEAKAAEQQQQGIGYPTNDSAPMQVQPGISSTEDAFNQAKAATPGIDNADADSLESGATDFKAAKPPDQPDNTGAVPNDVIDTGAIAAAAKARAAALFPGLANSLPGPYQQSANNTSNAVLSGIGSGALTGKDALDFYKSNQQEANSRIQNQMNEEGTNQRAADTRSDTAQRFAATQTGEAQRSAATRSDQNFKTGVSLAEKAADTYDLKSYMSRSKQYANALAALSSGSSADDAVAASSIIRLMGDNHISNADVDRILGGEGLSGVEEVTAKLHKVFEGGMPTPKRKALEALLTQAQGADEAHVNDYLNNAYNFADEPGNDPDQKKGYEASVKTLIPANKRAEILQQRNAAKQQAAGGAPQFRMDQNPEPDNSFQVAPKPSLAWQSAIDDNSQGLNADAIKRVVNFESRGKTTAKNASGATGFIQFMPQVAEAMGTTTDAIAKMSPSEQAQLTSKYFTSRGLTDKNDVGDYYVAVAAGARDKNGKSVFIGKPEGTVVYPIGSPAWKQNPTWRSNGDGPVTVGSLRSLAGRFSAGTAKDRLAELLAKEEQG